MSTPRFASSRYVFLTCGLLVLLAACGKHDAATHVAAHPWIHPPQGEEDKKAVELSPWLVYRVDPGTLDEAVAELKTEPYIQISPNMAAHFTGSEVRVPAEMRPFLIRGLTAGESDITVIQSMLGLWVRVRGSDLAKLAYQPLVVLIDPTPVDIYVTVEPKR